MIVFVYGTLLRGESNHHLLAAARLVGEAVTAPRYTLRDQGPYPALLDGGATAIAGELYDVDDATLARLDELEGHPWFYRRQPVALAGGAIAEGYLFVRADAVGPAIPSGDWRSRPR